MSKPAKAPTEAALIGSREIGFTIVSMTLSLVAVFIPLLLMGGLVGRLFREFAVTVSVAILMSGVVSLTLTPMMCGWLLRPDAAGVRTRRGRGMARGMVSPRACASMPPGCAGRCGHRLAMMAIMAATLAATVYLYIAIPKGFFPQQDNGLIVGTAEAAQDISYAAMVEREQRAGQDRDGRSRRADGLLLGRRQSDRQQRPHHDRPEADQRAPRRAPPRSSPGCAGKPPAFPASRCSARRARTCRSAPR